MFIPLSAVAFTAVAFTAVAFSLVFNFILLWGMLILTRIDVPPEASSVDVILKLIVFFKF